MIKKFLLAAAAAAAFLAAQAQTAVRPPIMGWASWNNYRVHINEDIIRLQAEAMASNGMREAGYTFVNVDDGFFGGRDDEGRLLVHPQRFPSGMDVLADRIHALGLRAGIYSDAGINTCGSIYDSDTVSAGCGLMGHEWSDLRQMLDEWGYDFIKVDWCGGQLLGADEQTRYTHIIGVARRIKPDVVFNVCRWQFPGGWVAAQADSWRISGDIEATFESVMRIVDLNADLWTYCTPGHYNDMDMLQVGRGMTPDEDRAHFSMWCMMVSPLLAGNDLTAMSPETLSILTNREVIALNQDPLCYQARRLRDDGDGELWAKPMIHTMSGDVAVALLNRSDTVRQIAFSPGEIGLDASAGYTMRDLWAAKNFGPSTAGRQSFSVPPHGVVVLRIKGRAVPHNIFQHK